MDRKIKSVAVPKKQPIYLIATDGIIGEECLDRKSHFICLKGETFGNVSARVINYIQKTPRNKELRVLISAGNQDISNENKYIEQNIINGKNDNIIKEILENFKKEMEILDKEVARVGGRLVIASLIPRPKEQCPNNGINKERPILLETLSNLFVKVNQIIYEYNKKKGNDFPNLKSRCERTGTKRSKTANDQQQNKIIISKFEEDGINLKNSVKSKLMVECLNHLKFL